MTGYATIQIRISDYIFIRRSRCPAVYKTMKLLEERIRKDGVVKEGNVLKVDSFLNHQMDVELFNEMGKEFKRLFADKPINKILTIEASGIGIACIVAQSFHVPVVFAKKSQSVNIDGDLYTSKVAPASLIKSISPITAQPLARKSSIISTWSSADRNFLETIIS